MFTILNRIVHACTVRLALQSVIVGAIGVSGSAVAQGYVGLSLGQSRADIDCLGAIDCDKNGTAVKVFGGYMLTPNLGLEATYYDRGSVRQSIVDPVAYTSNIEWSGQSYGIHGIVAAPFEGGALFAKLGVLRSELKREASVPSGIIGSRNNKTAFSWGLGASYKYSNDAAARIEFERIRCEAGGMAQDVDLLTLGFLFRF
jgi:opacity protein-like surface antigen